MRSYEMIDGGDIDRAPIKAWTRGVQVEDSAKEQYTLKQVLCVKG